uniref:Uncharacterized protein n=1 Tax=Arion vulgaris TaxID=1028688 RepID=A0A0B7A364_9EUPU
METSIQFMWCISVETEWSTQMGSSSGTDQMCSSGANVELYRPCSGDLPSGPTLPSDHVCI